jgi:hypothetical protein
MKLEPFLDGLSFGEGPRWHEGRLWYSDFYVTNSGSGPGMADKRDGRIETMRVDVPGAGWPWRGTR